MTNLRTVLKKMAPYALSISRIMVALLFLQHGTQKMLNFPAAETPMLLPIFSLQWFSGLIELVGGTLLVIGLGVRPVAVLLCGEMAVAYFLVHASASFFPILNRGELAVLYCFSFFYFFFAGGGAIGVDALFTRKRTE